MHLTRMEEARLRTNLISIENYQDQCMVSSCLMFAELINADTFRLKLNIHLMNILTEYHKSRGIESELADKKCSMLFSLRFV